MNSNMLEQLHQTLDEILDYASNVCEQNGLTYVLLYGSALGAYRHHGFIPWDDDLDIGLPRADYEKLLRILAEHPDPRYSIQNEENESNYFLSFSKIRKNDTLFVENYVGRRYKNNGAFIDVFPLDEVDDPNAIAQKLHGKHIRYLIHSLRFSVYHALYRQKQGKVRYLMDSILTAPARVGTASAKLRRLQRLMQRGGHAGAPFIAQFDDTSAAQMIPRDVYFPARQLEFNGKMRWVPGQIEKYLTLAYGSDYMQLPPPESRRTHEPLELKL